MRRPDANGSDLRRVTSRRREAAGTHSIWPRNCSYASGPKLIESLSRRSLSLSTPPPSPRAVTTIPSRATSNAWSGRSESRGRPPGDYDVGNLAEYSPRAKRRARSGNRNDRAPRQRGRKALPLCSAALVVHSDETGRIQEAHIAAGHALMELIEESCLDRSE